MGRPCLEPCAAPPPGAGTAANPQPWDTQLDSRRDIPVPCPPGPSRVCHWDVGLAAVVSSPVDAMLAGWAVTRGWGASGIWEAPGLLSPSLINPGCKWGDVGGGRGTSGDRAPQGPHPSSPPGTHFSKLWMSLPPCLPCPHRVGQHWSQPSGPHGILSCIPTPCLCQDPAVVPPSRGGSGTPASPCCRVARPPALCPQPQVTPQSNPDLTPVTWASPVPASRSLAPGACHPLPGPRHEGGHRAGSRRAHPGRVPIPRPSRGWDGARRCNILLRGRIQAGRKG